MKKTLTAVLTVVVIVIIGVAVWAATRHSNTSKKTNSSQTPSAMTNQPSQSSAASSAASSTAKPANATITYTDNGFSPSSVTLQAGGQLTVKNTAGDAVQFDSDPHPVHTDDTDLNVGVVSPGSSKTVTVSKKGTFGVHNHLDPSEKATVTID